MLKNHVRLMSAETKQRKSLFSKKTQILHGGDTMAIVREIVKKMENPDIME